MTPLVGGVGLAAGTGPKESDRPRVRSRLPLLVFVTAVSVLGAGWVLLNVRGRPDHLPIPEPHEVTAQFIDGHPVFVVRDPDGRVHVLEAVSPRRPFPKGAGLARVIRAVRGSLARLCVRPNRKLAQRACPDRDGCLRNPEQ